VSVNGVPLAGRIVLERSLPRLVTGDQLSLELSDGRLVSIPLAARLTKPPGGNDWARVIVVQVLMPWLCLALGFWVAGLRPTDPIAWLLLALLISFSLVASVRQAVPTAAMFQDLDQLYETLCGATWPIWMLLFGVYFPERLSIDRRWPKVKWALILPFGLLAIARGLQEIAGRHGFAIAQAVEPLLRPLDRPQQILGMMCISVFFMGLGMKTGTTSAPDARRRLRLLFTGAFIGLTPSFLVVMSGLVRGLGPFEGVPQWLAISALTMLFIFPLTLAYVIVVHRALDVRVVIRQGIQYAFARKGVQVLRVVLVVGILLAISAAASRPKTRQVDILRILGQGGMAIVAIGWMGEWVIRWTDRRFFREALDAERILNDLSEKVRMMVETAPLVETVAGTIAESLHVERVVFFLREEANQAGSYQPVCAVGDAGAPACRFAEGSGTIESLKRAREPLRVYLDDPRSWVNLELGANEAERTMLRDLGTQLLLPLAVKEKLPGFISLGAKRSEEPYSGTDLRLLQSVATQTGLALENSRLAAAIVSEVAQRERLNREVEIAREVQERLFPQTLPAVAGIDYSGKCRPALWVGGDYFDFMQLSDGRLGVAIADVSGKGIGAALLMACLQASLRGQTIRAEKIGQLIDNVNRLVFEASPDNRYATFFYGAYDPGTRVFSFVNAGHCPPIIMRAGNGHPEIIRLKAGGTVVGLFKDSVYQEGTVTLQSGDVLVAYTDGISEALNGDEEEWGEQRLIGAIARCGNLPAAETITRLMQDTDAFVDGAEQHDDMTLVVLRVV
ncbi:MAG TPA: GAF domain-containing SpoIIE family protein phosphatase, partial [Patescibacteria group bacterium]|nr:GAF domain-containing SpoIIE family protein phosphatase [Patescibacteria group bacterium]